MAVTNDPSSPPVAAREKFHCPACGADAHWNPAKQALVCPFCGTESPMVLADRAAATPIAEHDLIAALRALPAAARGWQAAKTSVRCQSCQAISVFDPDKAGQRCEFCGSAQLVPYEQTGDIFKPESLLPFKVPESQARDLIRAWYGRQWLAPNALAAKALTDTVKGVYLPYWTFDASAHAMWTAESGTYYYVREGGKQTQKVRWTRAAGELLHTFDDQLVPGSKGVKLELLRRVEPFPTSEVVPYDPGYLAGWVVERYQVDLENAAARARQEMDGTLRTLCASRVPGDIHRNLVVRSSYTAERFKHVLVPVWLLTYVYGAASYQVIVNGVTGNITGTHPWSWVKIALLVLAALVIVAILANLD